MKIWLIIPHANWHGILGFAFNTFLSVLAISSGFFPKSDLLIPLCRRLQPYSRDCIPDIYRDGSRCAWHRFWKGLLVLALASVWGWLFWLKFFSCNQVMTQNHRFLNWIHTDQQHRPSSLCNSAFLNAALDISEPALTTSVCYILWQEYATISLVKRIDI